jgi:hypothetical protein
LFAAIGLERIFFQKPGQSCCPSEVIIEPGADDVVVHGLGNRQRAARDCEGVRYRAAAEVQIFDPAGPSVPDVGLDADADAE